jgi:O-antigen/teichoic acid export membrane protein
MSFLRDKLTGPQPVLPAGPERAAVINGVYAVADYVALPLGMLLAAPYLLRHLGAAQFGVWLLASAAVSSGSLVSSGFGDAAVKYVAMYRGRSDWRGVERVVRAMLATNLSLGGVCAVVLWCLAPYAVHHIPHVDPDLAPACLQAFRIGAALLAIRSIDSVFVSTLRAVERYGPAVRISVYSRAGSLVASVVLVALGFGVTGIMLATLFISSIAAVAQAVAVRIHVGKVVLLPSFHRATISMIAGFGFFSWLQALSAVAFSQIDRIVVGIFLGAPAVAYYGICAQAAQPIHGIIAAGFHALFPHLSSRSESEPLSALKPTVITAFKINLALAALLAAPLVLFSYSILTVWMGQEFARQSSLVLTIIAASFALLALNVTAHYAMLAIGMVRSVTFINLAAGAAVLLLMLMLTPRFGVTGTACARLIYGPITWAMYLPLWRRLQASTASTSEPPIRAVWENS